MITLEQLKKNEEINTMITCADSSLEALGYTEHAFAHVTKVAETAGRILRLFGYDEHQIELVRVAGYLHDIGNLVNRQEHSQSGAVMAFVLLHKMGMPAADLATVTTAIGNHDEGTGVPVNPLAAALILADKTDVRRTRVRNHDMTTFDIHDRVNYSVESSELVIDPDNRTITLTLTINCQYGTVMDYFEIFLARMIMCRKAAESFGAKFHLMINGQCLL